MMYPCEYCVCTVCVLCCQVEYYPYDVPVCVLCCVLCEYCVCTVYCVVRWSITPMMYPCVYCEYPVCTVCVLCVYCVLCCQVEYNPYDVPGVVRVH